MLRCQEIRERSWDEAVRAAEEFITTLKSEQIVSVSHVSESPYAVVFVWYRPNP